MTSNVYTKNEILQNLASKGYFVDAYTLDTFFTKWKVEAIFEDEQGSEFYDKNALDLVLGNLFNEEKEEPKEKEKEVPPSDNTFENIDTSSQNNFEIKEEKINIDDSETSSLLNNISLSDGTPLLNKIQEDENTFPSFEINQPKEDFSAFNMPPMVEDNPKNENSKMGILEGAMISAGQEYAKPEADTIDGQIIPPNDEMADFDDISLLSESLEAQEKFKEYVMSELSKKNVDLTPKTNEFKLDISERTLNMIARTMAKKIAKHVSSICSADAKSAAQLAEIQETNKKLELKTRDLEEQNKKLRLLLAESNKNLNSYKPSIFGLYKKVNPKN